MMSNSDKTSQLPFLHKPQMNDLKLEKKYLKAGYVFFKNTATNKFMPPHPQKSEC